MVTRVSIDVLRSARVRREQYAGPWFPEPLLTDPYEDPERSAELADSVSMAALLLLERLTPPISKIAAEYWIIVHRDLRRAACVRAVIDWINALFAEQQDALAGVA